MITKPHIIDSRISLLSRVHIVFVYLFNVICLLTWGIHLLEYCPRRTCELYYLSLVNFSVPFIARYHCHISQYHAVPLTVSQYCSVCSADGMRPCWFGCHFLVVLQLVVISIRPKTAYSGIHGWQLIVVRERSYNFLPSFRKLNDTLKTTTFVKVYSIVLLPQSCVKL